VRQPAAHYCSDTALIHARTLDTRGTQPTPRGAGPHRAGGRATGRKFSVLHTSLGKRAVRQRRSRPRDIRPRGRHHGATSQPG
jgi:hypothetical protein